MGETKNFGGVGGGGGSGGGGGRGGYWMMRIWQGVTIQIFLNNHLQQRISLYFQILKRYCYIGFINKLNKLYFINV